MSIIVLNHTGGKYILGRKSMERHRTTLHFWLAIYFLKLLLLLILLNHVVLADTDVTKPEKANCAQNIL